MAATANCWLAQPVIKQFYRFKASQLQVWMQSNTHIFEALGIAPVALVAPKSFLPAQGEAFCCAYILLLSAQLGGLSNGLAGAQLALVDNLAIVSPTLLLGTLWLVLFIKLFKVD